jgi:hypothetical protein
VELFGPYIFGQPPELKLPENLVDACLEDISKTRAIELITRYSNPELPVKYFELLGKIDHNNLDGTVVPQLIYYRQIREDPGCHIWVHPEIQEFLQAEYKRLYFVRDLTPTKYSGDKRPPNSVFTPQFDRANSEITLRPVWDGEDVLVNLLQHVKVLGAEGLRNIFFEIDLAHAWQSNITPDLLKAGFQPCIVLPYGGDADVVVFECKRGAKSDR